VRVSTTKPTNHTKKRQELKFSDVKTRMELDVAVRGELIVGVERGMAAESSHSVRAPNNAIAPPTT
jgi:hypothetical protein